MYQSFSSLSVRNENGFPGFNKFEKSLCVWAQSDAKFVAVHYYRMCSIDIYNKKKLTLLSICHILRFSKFPQTLTPVRFYGHISGLKDVAFRRVCRSLTPRRFALSSRRQMFSRKTLHFGSCTARGFLTALVCSPEALPRLF